MIVAAHGRLVGTKSRRASEAKQRARIHPPESKVRSQKCRRRDKRSITPLPVTCTPRPPRPLLPAIRRHQPVVASPAQNVPPMLRNIVSSRLCRSGLEFLDVSQEDDVDLRE